ncbi:MAG: DNA/RNA nuclease SfsA [Rhodobacterales bacterium]|nr:DNA/RNA nuclease SfsA [Rhodobacterales bacterium]MDX5413307.1 DNA/RNA nuclease SfsA [Rhodobacterales bacterium]
MRFPTPLLPARLIRRYKRFLADVVPETGPDAGQQVVAHCPNPGSMLGLSEPGTRVWLDRNDDPRKKLRYGWRLVEHANGHFTGIDTGWPNRMLRAALEAGQVPELAAYDTVLPEQRYGTASRVDFLLRGTGLPDAYVEVKSVTLSRSPGLAEFPDSVTARGARHLSELAAVVRQGHRAILFYLVQRSDCTRFALATDIDPAYAAASDAARAAGVEVICHGCTLTPEGIALAHPVAPLHGSTGNLR